MATSNPFAVPVHKWGLKFNGDVSDISVHTFLERVEELRVARHVSIPELFTSSLDLFEGKGLVWYRSNIHRCHNWQDLANLLRRHYSPPDYRLRLFEDILARTQGPNESFVDFMTAMTAMFNRHGNISSDVRLGIVLRNLAPFYIERLPEVSSLDELERECLRIEVAKYRAENYRPPRRTWLEPDLTGVGPELVVPSASENTSPIESVSPLPSSRLDRNTRACFNCGQVGHLVRACAAPFVRKCFNCSRPGVTSKTCRNCHPSGNVRASRWIAEDSARLIVKLWHLVVRRMMVWTQRLNYA